jgi:hypothetical protein
LYRIRHALSKEEYTRDEFIRTFLDEILHLPDEDDKEEEEKVDVEQPEPKRARKPAPKGWVKPVSRVKSEAPLTLAMCIIQPMSAPRALVSLK